MKKLLPCAFLCWMFSSGLNAQITITQDDLPAINDTLRYSIAMPLEGYDFTQTGEDYVWDFSDIQFQTQRLDEYVSVNSVSFIMGLLFGSGSIAQKVTDLLPLDDFEVDVEDFYAVYTKNTQQYTQEGFFFIYAGFPVPLIYTTKDIVYEFPLTYMDNDSTAFAGNLSLGDTLHFEREGYRINEADGWGTVLTPYGEFDCLRVKTTLYESDSLYWESFPNPVVLRRTTVQYKWLAGNEKIPVMEASFLQMENENQVFMGVRYRDIYRDPIEMEAPMADFYAGNTQPAINDTVFFFNLSTPGHDVNTYQWSFEPDHVEFLQQTHAESPEPVVAFLQPGNYTVTLTAENETDSDTYTRPDYIEVTDTITGIYPYHELADTPTAVITHQGQFLEIKFGNTTGTLTLYDTHGRELLHRENLSFNRAQTDISGLSPGTYIVKMVTQQQKEKSYTIKFIKQPY